MTRGTTEWTLYSRAAVPRSEAKGLKMCCIAIGWLPVALSKIVTVHELILGCTILLFPMLKSYAYAFVCPCWTLQRGLLLTMSVLSMQLEVLATLEKNDPDGQWCAPRVGKSMSSWIFNVDPLQFSLLCSCASPMCNGMNQCYYCVLGLKDRCVPSTDT